ncbi:MAG: SUMF1/EgtB/PvdO family nonheme iron enzyme [Candidatus Sumerlaeia bacterium]|nr:SUMF1/EgtB/PvdO family nonheme iron enzyme [Candidatus Sumerlaeia bacterium]
MNATFPPKGLALLLPLLLLGSVAISESNLPGDVDGSGFVNLGDVAQIRDHLLDRKPLEGDSLVRADVNEDGRIDLEDIAEIQRRFSPSTAVANLLVVDSVAELSVQDWNSSDLVLGWSGIGDHGIQAGTYLVGTAFDGFLVRVLTVGQTGTTLSISTTPATLAEVLVGGQAGALPSRLGLPVGASAKVQTLGGTNPDEWDRIEWTLSGEALFAAEGVTVELPTAVVTLRPEIELAFAIESGQLTYFHAVADGHLGVDLAAQVVVAGPGTWSEERAIPDTTLTQTYVQYVGEVPVVEVVTFELVGRVEVEALGAVEFESGQAFESQVRVGAEYASGSWRELRGFGAETPSTSLDWQANAAASVRVAVFPRIEVEFYAFDGPSFTIEPFIDFDTGTTWNPLACSYKLDVGVDASLDLSLDVLDPEIPHAGFDSWGLYRRTLRVGGCSPHPVGMVSIDVTPDSGAWTLAGPPGFGSVSGSGDRLGGLAFHNVPAGLYTLTSDNNVSNHVPPNPIARELVTGGSIHFEPVHTQVLFTGRIDVHPFPEEGSWTLTGPTGFATRTGSGTRTGVSSINNVPPGSYTLIPHDALPGYTAPSPRTRGITRPGETLAFAAVWTPLAREEVTLLLPGDVPLVLVRVPAGSFTMGSPVAERDTEIPLTNVSLPQDLYMGKHEVTQQQWFAVMGAWPQVAPSVPNGIGAEHPIYGVSWHDAQEFLSALNNHLRLTGQVPDKMRLPTEAEWEYAARAGTTTRFHFSDIGGSGCTSWDLADQFMWYCGITGSQPVGRKLPNMFGLHDMYGNVFEWCNDWDLPFLPGGDLTNPIGPSSGVYRVLRGGAWANGTGECRSSFRTNDLPSAQSVAVGFRIASWVPPPAACAITVDPVSTAIPSGGAAHLQFAVVAEAGCDWIAATNEPWIAVVDGFPRSGAGSVTYHVASNFSSSQRTGFITIGGNIHTVFQEPMPPDGPETRTVLLHGGVVLELVRIPAGAFLMGSPQTEQGREAAEGPQTSVTLAADFYMSKHVVTNAQWESLMRTRRHPMRSLEHPVHDLSWVTAQEFVRVLNDHIGASGQGPPGMRLPTEAEWEYAARAGTSTRFSFGNSLPGFPVLDGCMHDLVRDQHMWYCANSNNSAQPVRRKLPNAFGLHDMHGNVFEWCQDWFESSLPGGNQTNPSGPSEGSQRVIRGGAHFSTPDRCRSAARGGLIPTSEFSSAGIRLVTSFPRMEPCEFEIEPSARTIPATGATDLTIAVTAQDECYWKATSEVPWIGIRDAFWRAGQGSVVFSVASNFSSSPRSGTITVGDQTHTVTQEPSPPGELAEVTILLEGGVPLSLVRVPAGSFVMGSPSSERGRSSNESPQTSVTLSRAFYLGKYPVTQSQWLAVSKGWPRTAPSEQNGAGPDHPAYNVAWSDVDLFVSALNQYIASSGQGPFTVRLPTEAEWEYSARAGTTTRFHFGDSLEVGDACEGSPQRDEHMWYCWNSSSRSQAVGRKLPNALGLHDMHGNVREWCSNYYGALPGGSVTDPVGPSSSSNRVTRGGSWNQGAVNSRSAVRTSTSPSTRSAQVGFRIAATR